MSEQRLTFRKTCGLLAYQKQLRDSRLSEGCPIDPSRLVLSNAVIKRVDREIAKSIILRYEWLGTLPPLSLFYGIFFDGHCAGVVCFAIGGGGANIHSYKELGLKSQHELAYLARGANVHWSPTGANSKLVSIACRLVKKDSVAKAVIAYSDTDAGEIGTIYQACNWTCIGRGKESIQWANISTGRIYNLNYPYRLRNQYGGTVEYWIKRLKREGWETQPTNPKYRYVYVLDRSDERLMRLVKSKQTPYPKRPAEIAHKGEQPAHQPVGAFDSTVPLNVVTTEAHNAT